MTEFFKVLTAEMIKQHKNYFHSRTIYMALFVWPVLSFITTCYSFRSFDLTKSKVSYISSENMVIYLLIGYMCMNFFRSLVNSSHTFSYERIYGTLELIYLSPASRLAVLTGNTISSLFESSVVMAVFTAVMVVIEHPPLYFHPGAFLILALLTTGMAVSWGIFLNVMFLFSRDNDFLYTVLEEPMESFAGVKVPFSLYPMWAKGIGGIFPLTYALEAVRRVLLSGSTLYEVRWYLWAGVAIIIALTGAALKLLKKAEHHIRITGNMNCF